MAKGLHKGQHKVKKVQWHIYYTTRYMCGQNQIQKFKKTLCVFCISRKQPGTTQDTRHSSIKYT